MVLGEAMLSVVLKQVLSKLASPDFSELGSIYHVKDKLRRLQKTLKWIQAMLWDMEQRQINDESSKVWVQELQGTAYDLEDLLEDFEYEELCRKGQDGGSVTGSDQAGGCLQLLMENLALRAFSITDCAELVQWPEGEGFPATLLSLEEKLIVKNCPKLMALPKGCFLSASLKKLTIRGCPYVADGSLFTQLHNLITSDRVYVENAYPNLASFCEAALQHIRELDILEITYVEHDDGDGESLRTQEFLDSLCNELPVPVAVLLVYDQERPWIPGRRLEIKIQSTAWNRVSIEGSLFRCLQSCHLSTSLRWLIIQGFPHKEFTHSISGEDPFSLQFDSVLVIKDCRRIRKLPNEMLLLSSLRKLTIINCLEMTLSSLEEGICSLPFLRRLSITDCPKLHITGSPSSSPYASSSSSPPSVLLESLCMDDFKLISDQHFVGNHLTSLKELHLCHFKLTSFVMVAEVVEGLRRVAGTVELVEFWMCSNLLYLPSELLSLFPSLKCVQIKHCPKIRCLPETGLPASLERLEITGCPTLAMRCRHPRVDKEDSDGEDATRSTDASLDWQLVARIPNIEIDGRIVQGFPGAT